jgi:HAD superfamily hydrolase (TIGR01662 family)
LRYPEEHTLRAVLFDLGSTLIYFDGDWKRINRQRNSVLLERLHDSGVHPHQELFLDKFHVALSAYFSERDTEFIEYTTAHILRTVLAELGQPPLSDPTVRHVLAGMYAVTQKHWLREDDALPTLETLRDMGFKLGLISNASDDADVQSLVDQASLRPYFDAILTSAALGVRKPNPRIFKAALKHWGYLPSQAVMVGDSLGADILGARNAGMYSVWITRRADTAANRAHEDTVQPDAVIARLSELPELLQNANGAFPAR